MVVRTLSFPLLILITFATAALLAPKSATAATFCVDVTDANGGNSGDCDSTCSGNGSDDCDLSEAIAAANADATADEIVFDPTVFDPAVPKTITDDSLPDIVESLTISGPGATALFLDGDSNGRVLTIDSGGSGAAVTISGVGIVNGEGGIFVRSDADSLVVSNCLIFGNDSTGPSEPGGGIAHLGNALTVSNTQIFGNVAEDAGGGIFAGFLSSTSVTIENSMIEGNSAPGGGGLAIIADQAVTITGSRVSNNYYQEHDIVDVFKRHNGHVCDGSSA